MKVFLATSPFTEPMPRGFVIIIGGGEVQNMKKYNTFVLKLVKY